MAGAMPVQKQPRPTPSYSQLLSSITTDIRWLLARPCADVLGTRLVDLVDVVASPCDFESLCIDGNIGHKVFAIIKHPDHHEMFDPP